LSDYLPSDALKTRAQLLWAIRNLSIISSGAWPEGHKEYLNGIAKRNPSSEATFVRPATLAAEVNSRLRSCGIWGMAIEYVIANENEWKWAEQKVAHYLGESLNDTKNKINLAIRYCTGERKRKTSFKHYCGYNERRQNGKS
jgi:hypothetical protein